MKRSAKFLLLIILFFLSQQITAQPSATLYFTTAFPVGEFKDFLPNTGIGASSEWFFFSPSRKTPYGLGISLSYISYGANLFWDPYYEDVFLSLNGANNFASAHLLFQIAPHAGSVRPYLETLFGGSYIYSSTEIGGDYYGPYYLWVDDWAWSYGAGAGIKFIVHGDPYFNSGSVYIDMKIRYLFSTSTTYIDGNSVYLDGDVINYSTYESKTDMITASLGLYFYF